MTSIIINNFKGDIFLNYLGTINLRKIMKVTLNTKASWTCHNYYWIYFYLSHFYLAHTQTHKVGDLHINSYYFTVCYRSQIIQK